MVRDLALASPRRKWQGGLAKCPRVDPYPADTLAFLVKVPTQSWAIQPKTDQSRIHLPSKARAEAIGFHKGRADAFGNEAGSAKRFPQRGRDKIPSTSLMPPQTTEAVHIDVYLIGVVKLPPPDVVEADNPATLRRIVLRLK
ncbi:hypothetical protein ASF32_00100 [Methylobacterium sp. Leaf91]|nr:hypothetical protein ASF32_00100 [Methylobacterium sp. Leaf91]